MVFNLGWHESLERLNILFGVADFNVDFGFTPSTLRVSLPASPLTEEGWWRELLRGARRGCGGHQVPVGFRVHSELVERGKGKPRVEMWRGKREGGGVTELRDRWRRSGRKGAARSMERERVRTCRGQGGEANQHEEGRIRVMKVARESESKITKQQESEREGQVERSWSQGADWSVNSPQVSCFL